MFGNLHLMKLSTCEMLSLILMDLHAGDEMVIDQ